MAHDGSRTLTCASGNVYLFGGFAADSSFFTVFSFKCTLQLSCTFTILNKILSTFTEPPRYFMYVWYTWYKIIPVHIYLVNNSAPSQHKSPPSARAITVQYPCCPAILAPIAVLHVPFGEVRIFLGSDESARQRA